MSDSWTIARLSDVLSEISDRAGKQNLEVLSVTEKRGIVPQSDVFNRRIATEDISDYKVLEPLDIAFNPYLLWAGAIGQWMGETRGVVSPVYPCFRAKESENSRWLGLVFESAVLRPYFDSTAIGSIVRRRRTTIHVFLNAELQRPPRSVQNRIVDVISSVDSYIAALQQQADAARVARSAVLSELLSAGGEDWTDTTLGEAGIVNPKSPALAKDAPFVPMDAVQVGRRFVTYFEPRGERSGARASSGDVLFARITPCLENGKVAQIPDGIGMCGGSTEFIVIRGTEQLSADFAYYWATSEQTRTSAARLMTGTTGRQRLSWQDLASLQLNLPPLSEQQRIVGIISSLDDLVLGSESAVTEATNVRSALLSDLLSGNHEIPESYDRLLGAA